MLNKENTNTKEGITMHRLLKWLKRKGRWAVRHRINPKTFILIYLGGIFLSWTGAATLSYGLSINSEFIWVLGVTTKLIGMAAPGLYIVIRGKKLNWRVKPIILLIIVASVAFFTWRVPSRIKDLIFWLVDAAE